MNEVWINGIILAAIIIVPVAIWAVPAAAKEFKLRDSIERAAARSGAAWGL